MYILLAWAVKVHSDIQATLAYNKVCFVSPQGQCLGDLIWMSTDKWCWQKALELWMYGWCYAGRVCHGSQWNCASPDTLYWHKLAYWMLYTYCQYKSKYCWPGKISKQKCDPTELTLHTSFIWQRTTWSFIAKNWLILCYSHIAII